MKRVIFAVFAILFIAASIQTTSLLAQKADLKIGVVDIEVILKEMPEAKDADQKLKDIGTKWQDTLLTMKKDFDAKVATYQKQKSLKTPAQQQQEEESLQQLQTQLLQYQDAKFGQQGELASMREQFLDPIRGKVKTGIDKVSKDEKISLVFDKSSSALLYFDDKFDLTYKVLDVIKRGNN